VTAAAHRLDDEPIDPAEEPMPEAAFQAIERAHLLCGHPAAVDLTVDLGNSELSNTKHVLLLPHATKILSAQIRALALVERGEPPLFQIIEKTRPMLAETRPTKERIHILWAAAKAARKLGAEDVVRDAFMVLAIETNLINERDYWTGNDVRDYVRRHGAEDVEHVITWALRGWNPFEKGPLK
jgi:hypothetical protein